MDVRRREFLKVAAVSSAGAVAFAGCYIPEQDTKVQSPTHIPEDWAGDRRDAYYATSGALSDAGTGLVVRVFEGRAKKVEGNPDHPVNVGKSSAVSQAELQVLYNPDRIAAPQKLSGPRGSATYTRISWQDAINEATAKLKDARGGRVVLMTGPLTATQAVIAQRFVDALGGSRLMLDPMQDNVYRAAVRQVFATEQLPYYDISRARTVLSFGADWLSTWGSTVRQQLDYGSFRQARNGTRGYVIHVDSRHSATAANADEWIAVKPGTEGLLALAIAHSLATQNLGDRAVLPANSAQALNAFRAEAVAEATGVKAEKITAIAKKIGSEGPTIVIGGGSAGAQTNGLFNLTQILNLNFLLGSVGLPGGVRFNPPSPLVDVPSTVASSYTDWEREMIRIRGLGENAVILLFNANPVFCLPPSLGIKDAISKAGTVISFSNFLDESSELADLMMPACSAMEEFGVAVPPIGPGYEVVSMRQPVVNKISDTQPFGDAVIRIAQAIGGDVARALPWGNSKDTTRELVRPLYNRRSGSVVADDFESFWNGILQRGGWWSTSSTGASSGRAATLPSAPDLPRFAGEEKDFKYYLNVFEHNTLGSGNGPNARLPWLQGAPDPVTTAVWGTWVEVNYKVAKELGVDTNDVVRVESPNGWIEAPVYKNPSTPDWTIAIPAGNGHSMKIWSDLNGPTGVNPLTIIAPMVEVQSGAYAWAATRVKVTKTGRKLKVQKLEGYVPPVQKEHGDVVEITNN